MIQHPARQVHLDFHTSEHIPDVGRLFDKKQWQEALKIGRVNAINIFAKGHHGWAYYPTKAGAVHPTLDRDLLGEQIAACHQIGVRCPIYFTVGWSVHDAETHPEWIVRDKAGNIWPTDPKLLGTPAPDDRRQACSWRYLCPSAGYMDLILAQTAEILQAYQVDGFWYDICGGPVCYCDTCLAGMRAEGYDPELEADARAYNALKWERFMTACNDLVLQHFPEATIYYNGTTVMYPDSRHSCHDGDYWKLNTHYELEDLPTTWGGYDKFSMRSKYFLKTGKQIIAMSGKFHTSWGEFGGFKHPDALRYEAATQIAHGAACNFGDQLHPSGLMDMGTYANLGEAFKHGFEHPGEKSIVTLARLSTLSFQLSLYFEGWIKRLCQQTSGDIYTVYAGGDDVFLIGPWAIMTDLAQEITGEFQRYTCNPGLTLSGGMTFIHGKYPVYQAADDAGQALDKAKRIDGKNAFTFLDRPWKWTEFSELSADFNKLEHIISDLNGPHGLLQVLQQLAKMEEDWQQSHADKKRTWGRWMWMGDYRLTRLARLQKNKELAGEIEKVLEELKKEFYCNIIRWGTAARWVQLYTRKTGSDK